MVMKQKRSQHSDVIDKYRSKMEELDKEEEKHAQKLTQKVSLFLYSSFPSRSFIQIDSKYFIKYF